MTIVTELLQNSDFQLKKNLVMWMWVAKGMYIFGSKTIHMFSLLNIHIVIHMCGLLIQAIQPYLVFGTCNLEIFAIYSSLIAAAKSHLWRLDKSQV